MARKLSDRLAYEGEALGSAAKYKEEEYLKKALLNNQYKGFDNAVVQLSPYASNLDLIMKNATIANAEVTPAAVKPATATTPETTLPAPATIPEAKQERLDALVSENLNLGEENPHKSTAKKNDSSDNTSEPGTSDTNDDYTTSSYSAAEKYLEDAINQLRAGRTSITDKLDALINDYMNRDSFSYDPNADTLYQTYLAAMQNAGQLAMRDTMGQAAALTGGYGSSYATAAANGAYNNYLQQANQALPDYYNMALDEYNREGNRMLQNINLLNTQDEKEYERLLNSYKEALNTYNNYNAELKGAYTEPVATGLEALKGADVQKIKQNAVNAFGKGGVAGKRALETYLDTLSGYDLSAEDYNSIMDTVDKSVPEMWTLVEEPAKFGKKDNVYTDKWGERYTYEELEAMYYNGKISKKIWKQINKLGASVGDVFTE